MGKVHFLTCIRKRSIREAASWGKYWIYFRIRLYVILGLGEAVHIRVMCLQQVLGLRSAGPAREKESYGQSREDQRPIGAYKDELVFTWVCHCLQDTSVRAELQKSWCISPSMELPTNPAHDSERLKVVRRELKERGLPAAPHSQGEPAGPQQWSAALIDTTVASMSPSKSSANFSCGQPSSRTMQGRAFSET